MYQKSKKKNTIMVTLEAYLYLENKCYEERSGKNISEKGIKRLKRHFEDLSYQGYKKMFDGDLGGCKGDPLNAWEERRWTSWSASDMARILDEAGLDYKMGEQEEVIDIYLQDTIGCQEQSWHPFLRKKFKYFELKC